VEEQFKEIFDKHFDSLYYYAYTFLKDEELSKDVVQTTFTKLWENRNSVDINTTARAYLYRSVHNLSLNVIRDRRTRDSHYAVIKKDNEGQMSYLNDPDTMKTIQTAIDGLPPKCKEVFVMSRFDGKSYAQIATELNISMKTVEAQIGKALKTLRQQLAHLTSMIYLPIILNHINDF
jgi:RNA polymerase sigma-70 factor, ECF subfamily